MRSIGLRSAAHSLRHHKWTILTTMVLCTILLSTVVLTVPTVRLTVKSALKRVGLISVVNRFNAALTPAQTVQVLSPDRVSARRDLIVALYGALERKDFQQVALLNSILAQEAFQRAHRTLLLWEKLRDTETGLVPRGTNFREAFWNPKDTGADLFPFLLLTSQYVDRNERLWLDSLAKERKICGIMPCTIYFQPTTVIQENLSDTIFGASEYAKDGLLAVVERSGPGPWFERLEEIAQALIGVANVGTQRGKIPSSDTEVNGNMLQVLSRLYWATKNVAYLQMAERIAEAYLFDILPQNGYLPSSDWDFSKGTPASTYFSFRDHGSEIIPGLSEIYFLEKTLKRPQALLYRAALKSFYDLILQIGRTDDGLWYSVVNTKTHVPWDKEVADTWGYILNGLQAFDLAEGTSVYAHEIRRTMKAAAARKSFTWEVNMPHDGYADTIESMLYLLPWFDDSECARWVDDEIEVMFQMQSASGVVSGGYLDGNFNRTALLYATYKTQGITAHPWREDVYVGAAYDKKNKDVYVNLSVAAQWHGVLKFDLPRHRTIWSLPFEYPRLNGTPEWFVVQPAKSYAVVNLKTEKKIVVSGRALAEGLKVNLGETDSSVSLKIFEYSGPQR
jgi:hypothetical protein